MLLVAFAVFYILYDLAQQAAVKGKYCIRGKQYRFLIGTGNYGACALVAMLENVNEYRYDSGKHRDKKISRQRKLFEQVGIEEQEQARTGKNVENVHPVPVLQQQRKSQSGYHQQKIRDQCLPYREKMPHDLFLRLVDRIYRNVGNIVDHITRGRRKHRDHRKEKKYKMLLRRSGGKENVFEHVKRAGYDQQVRIADELKECRYLFHSTPKIKCFSVIPYAFRIFIQINSRVKSILTPVVFLISVICSAVFLQAQPGDGRMPFSWAWQSAFPVPTVKLQAPDVDSLRRADEMEAAEGLPYRFGYALPVNLDRNNAGENYTLPTGGSLWLMKIAAPGAVSLNLNFDEFYLPEGCYLWVYNETKQHYLGGFSHRNNNLHRNFATVPVSADQLIIELYEPSHLSGKSSVRISEVVYGYRDGGFEKGAGFGQSGACNVNVNCPEAEGWENERQAVVMLLTSNNTRKCSGTMITNTAGDGTPYVLTARHCNTLTNAIFMFNYQSDGCSLTDGPTTMTAQGCDIVAENSFSDFSLLRLHQSPLPQYGIFYAGWSRDSIPGPLSYGIHHPSGDVKKFSVDSDFVAPANYLGGTVPGGSHWQVADWDLGTTEGGSSGSCLLGTDHRIRGQLHGGFAACTNELPDYYGRFDISWSNGADSSLRLSDWLDPLGTDTIHWNGEYIPAPYYDRDIELVSFSAPSAEVCDTVVAPVLQVTSWGQDTVTSVLLGYVFNGDTATAGWSGTAAFMDTIFVTLPALQLAPQQSYTLQAFVLQVNGSPDEYVPNDTVVTAFQSFSGSPFRLEWQTDNAPLEASWNLKDETGTVIASGSYTDADSLFTPELCLRPSCYTFTATDAAGNGLCCGNGYGYFSLSDPAGNVLAFRSAFGASEVVRFCFPEYPAGEPVFIIYPVPNDGSFNLVVEPHLVGKDIELSLSDMSGRIVARRSFTAAYVNPFSFPSLAAGIYHVYIYSDYQKKTKVQKILVVR